PGQGRRAGPARPSVGGRRGEWFRSWELLARVAVRESGKPVVRSLPSRYNGAMITVSVHEVQRDPLGCLRRVEGGATLLVLRDDRPVGKIRPVCAPLGPPRPFGLCAGQFVVPDAFDQPLPEELVEEFEGQ